MNKHIHSIYFPKGTGFQHEFCHGKCETWEQASSLLKRIEKKYLKSNHEDERYQYEPFFIEETDVEIEAKADCVRKISLKQYAINGWC